MALNNYFEHKKNQLKPSSTNTNIVELLRKTKLEEKKDKRQNIYFAAAAISVVALSGFIISQ